MKTPVKHSFLNRPRMALFIAVAVISSLFIFQNCELTNQSPRPSQFDRKLGGQGYDGKIYTHYGVCKDDKLELKTVLRDLGVSGFEILRQDCVDLPQPIAASQNLRRSAYDNALLVHNDEVFDGDTSVTKEVKLTTAFCYAQDPQGLEVSVWYNSDVWQTYPDPRLATELYGKITMADNWDSGVIQVLPPQVFTDRLVYSANDFELIETRDGLSSHLKFSRDGRPYDLTLECHRQAAPKFLEADVGYFLRLSPLSDLGGGYALISHDVDRDLDLFKKKNYSLPTADHNPLVGWNAGYLSIQNKFYEMRKTIGEDICFGPAEDPRAPCVMTVLGRVNSPVFKNLYENINLQAKNVNLQIDRLLPKFTLEAPILLGQTKAVAAFKTACGGAYPKQMNWQTYSDFLGAAADLLVYLNDETAHSKLRTSLLAGTKALIADMPANIYQTPQAICNGRDLLTANTIIPRLNKIYKATGDASIRQYILAQAVNVDPVMQAMKEKVTPSAKIINYSIGGYTLSALGESLSLMIVYDELGVKDLDVAFWAPTIQKVLAAQVLSSSQTCANQNSYGGWIHFNKNCVMTASSPMVTGLIDLHRWLGHQRALLGKEALTEWGDIETKTGKSILAALAFRYNALSTDPLNNSGKLIFFTRLIGFASSMSLVDYQKIQNGYLTSERVSIGDIKAAEAVQNKTFFSYRPHNEEAVPVRTANIEARLSELTAERRHR
jgi:hypothetical protein